MPQSRHRKSKARKKPRGLYPSSPNKPQPTSNTNWRTIGIAIVVIVALGVVAFVWTRRRADAGPETVTASGLKYVDIVSGDGPNPQVGQTVTVNYTGTLLNGKKFDSSFDHGQPYKFRIGRGEVIKGWDEGLMTMKVGGKRKLTVPPELGYGVRGFPPDIPPNATLQFEVELLDIK